MISITCDWCGKPVDGDGWRLTRYGTKGGVTLQPMEDLTRWNTRVGVNHACSLDCASSVIHGWRWPVQTKQEQFA